jgi:carbon-monoxide dehydrogenase iron sulfur subunit
LRRAIIPYFDLCTGCRTCELACSMAKFQAYVPRLSHIQVTMESKGLRSQPHVCEQCQDPACWRSCPEGAFVRDERTGAVLIVPEKCTGCRNCVRACPVSAIRFDEAAHKAIKCDLCYGDPQCVRYCPTGALEMK